MVSAVHHELDAFGNGAELPDNQSITDEIVEVRYVLLELVCAINIIIVGLVSDDDAGILHHILDVAKARNLRIREGKTLFASEGSIATLMGCSRKQAGIILKRLCERGLLIRSETKHPEFQTYSYSVCEEKVRSFVTPGCEETSQGDAKKVPTQMGRNVTSPCNLTSHDNKKDKYIYNSMNIDESELVKRKNTYGKYRNSSLVVGDPGDFRKT